jgi:Mn2+/Fe2+ NRAMP family transporter
VAFQRSRRGTPDDRGKILPWKSPVPNPAPPRPLGLHGFFDYFKRVAPGIVTGTADVDPALVLTATVAGAAYGYSLLWVVVLCVPFLITVFSVSGRLGFETRKGLVDLLRQNYGRTVAITCACLVVAINLAMIVADLMAVSDALSIILGLKRYFFIAIVAFSVWYILIFHDYRRFTRTLLWLSLPLFIYVVAAVVAPPSPGWVLLSTVMPRVSHDPGYVAALVGIFGSLLTPYVLVWQTSSRREYAEHGEHLYGAESHAGGIVTCLLAYSIIVAAGSMLHMPNASDMTTRQAAAALRPVVGNLGEHLFALGIIGAGMVALPVLVASMCYSISEAAGWRSGLSERPWEAKGFYVLISGSMLVAGALNFLPINPVKALFWSQILAGILTVPILIFMMILSNDRRIMHSVNTRMQNFWLGAAIGGLVAAGLTMLWWKLF